jgi:hypothetical protein
VKYPSHLSMVNEDDTIDLALQGMSLARFGDGELRLAIGADSISQRERSPQLMAELRAMLKERPANCLVCIPNIDSATPKADSWAKYADPKFVSLYGQQVFGSSFITRPDSAPWIDRPDYWDKVEQLWRGKEITLVVGDEKSLTPERCASAAKIHIVQAPRKNAYTEIDRIEADVMTTLRSIRPVPVPEMCPVLICLGATATVLAARLSQRGVHALDLGHIGMFRRHAGAYRYALGDLVSPGYRATLQAMHGRGTWGADGHKHADAVRALAGQVGAVTILDYGCGREMLAKAMAPVRVSGYDPGIPGKEGMPKPCDLVVCTDVLEHVEEAQLDNVLDHLSRLAGKALYLVIATRPANAILPDGRNAHLIVKSAEWWMARQQALGFTKVDCVSTGRELQVTLIR